MTCSINLLRISRLGFEARRECPGAQRIHRPLPGARRRNSTSSSSAMVMAVEQAEVVRQDEDEEHPGDHVRPRIGHSAKSATTGSSARSAGAAWGSFTRPSRYRWADAWRSASPAGAGTRAIPADPGAVPPWRPAPGRPRLHHTNIVPVYDVGPGTGGCPVFRHAVHRGSGARLGHHRGLGGGSWTGPDPSPRSKRQPEAGRTGPAESTPARASRRRRSAKGSRSARSCGRFSPVGSTLGARARSWREARSRGWQRPSPEASTHRPGPERRVERPASTRH